MVDFRISCRPASYGKYAMHAFENLPEIGVKYVEIDVPKNKKAAEIQLDMFEEMGIQALSLCYPIVSDDKKAVEKFEAAIPIIKMFKPHYLFTSVKPKKAKNLEKGYETLKMLGDIAHENGLYFSMETHPPYNTNGDMGKKSMETINSLGFKINFDTANIYYYNENVDGKTELKKVLPWLGSIHIKDCMKEYKKWNFPEIGKGKVDFPGIIELLKNNIKDDQIIPLTLEIEGVKGESLSLEETLARVKNSVDYLSGLIN